MVFSFLGEPKTFKMGDMGEPSRLLILGSHNSIYVFLDNVQMFVVILQKVNI